MAVSFCTHFVIFKRSSSSFGTQTVGQNDSKYHRYRPLFIAPICVQYEHKADLLRDLCSIRVTKNGTLFLLGLRSPEFFLGYLLFSIIFNRRHRFIFFTSSVPLCWLFATLVCLFRVTQYRNSSPGSILFLIGHS